jgi:KEOPS complex subunit Cgi121
MITVIGSRGTIKDIDDFLQQVNIFSQDNNVVIQAFNADVIYGKNHLISAVDHAIRAMERKTNTTNSLAMEILLYAAGERQLKLAIPKMGVKKGDANIAFVVVNDKKRDKKSIDELLKDLSLERDDKILEGNEDTLRAFGLNDQAIKTVTKDKYGDLILEKVAMVDIIK